MPESKFEFEIPPGYYTREELNNYILNMLNTPIHVCCTTKGCRGLMVKASGWQSFDRQFDPYPRAIKVAPLWCSLGCRSESDGRIHQ